MWERDAKVISEFEDVMDGERVTPRWRGIDRNPEEIKIIDPIDDCAPLFMFAYDDKCLVDPFKNTRQPCVSKLPTKVCIKFDDFHVLIHGRPRINAKM
jgi:hypothetical protein